MERTVFDSFFFSCSLSSRWRDERERKRELHPGFPCNYFLVRLFGFNSTLLTPLLRGCGRGSIPRKNENRSRNVVTLRRTKISIRRGGWKVNFHRWVVTEGNWGGRGGGVEIASTGGGTKFRRNILRHHRWIK